jgi:hypothetical protein
MRRSAYPLAAAVRALFQSSEFLCFVDLAMMGWTGMRSSYRHLQIYTAIAVSASLLLCATLCACTTNEPKPEPQAAAAPPPPPPPSPPPVNLSGRWNLAAKGAGSCVMTFADTPGAVEGTIAPAGGCPGNFFTSRKWTFEHDALIIRDHKGEPLGQLAFGNGRFEGRATGGATVSLTR